MNSQNHPTIPASTRDLTKFHHGFIAGGTSCFENPGLSSVCPLVISLEYWLQLHETKSLFFYDSSYVSYDFWLFSLFLYTLIQHWYCHHQIWVHHCWSHITSSNLSQIYSMQHLCQPQWKKIYISTTFAIIKHDKHKKKTTLIQLTATNSFT